MITKTFETELAARRYMTELYDRGVRYSYWHASCCEFVVTIL